MILTMVMVLGLGASECADYDKAPYDQAYNRCMKTGRPLFALLGAPWCPACPQAHVFVPRLHKLGEYGYVNVDKDKELFQQLGEGPIPRLFVFRRIKDKWERSTYVGADNIKAFVEQEDSGKVAPATTTDDKLAKSASKKKS